MEGPARDHRHTPAPAGDVSRLRISDADRHRISEVLREAAGEGRLELHELEERLEATFAAKTYADLVPITADLPGRGGTTVPAMAHPQADAPAFVGPTYTSSIAVMAETKRVGNWQLEDGHTAFALMGAVLLDLRDARFAGRELTINANALMGEVKIYVNAHTAVVVEGHGVMGEFAEGRAKVDPQLSVDSPVVRVKGLALMGSVTVRRRGPDGQRRRLLPR